MKDVRQFILFWLVGSFIFYFAPYVVPSLIVTGNARLSPFLASVVSAFLLTVAITVVQPFFTALKIKLADQWQWMLAYFFVNVVSVWVIARYADLTGVGIQNAWVAVLLGAILNLAQWGSLQLIFPKSK